MKCPNRKLCDLFINEQCIGELPNKTQTYICKSKKSWLIEPVKEYGSNITSHLQEQIKRKNKSKRKTKRSRLLTKKEIRRNPIKRPSNRVNGD
jgi:hypothetical protein